MDFSIAYFGKSLNDLIYNDIVEYFNEPKQESETIEFKSFPERATFDAGLHNVIRGISAFLNSSGGILIWGAPVGKKQQGLTEKIFVSDLAPVKELKEKDALINRISSSITPLPVGVSVKILSLNGLYVYVFEIQPSSYKPHQFDTRYYVRLDAQTKPAPHYLIDAMMKQIKYPNLNGVIKFHEIGFDRINSRYHLPITIAIFNFSELQNEEMVSFRLLTVGAYFRKGRVSQLTVQEPRYNMNGQQLIFENFANVLHFGTPNIHDDVLIVDNESMKEQNGIVNLLLSFGGKKSPAKVSSYKLNFNNDIVLAKPNALLIEVKENIMFSDLKQQRTNTNEDSLSAFLGR